MAFGFRRKIRDEEGDTDGTYYRHTLMTPMFDPGPNPFGNPAIFLAAVGELGSPSAAPFINPIKDFYLTNPIARASVTMAQCAGLAAGAKMAAE